MGGFLPIVAAEIWMFKRILSNFFTHMPTPQDLTLEYSVLQWKIMVWYDYIQSMEGDLPVVDKI